MPKSQARVSDEVFLSHASDIHQAHPGISQTALAKKLAKLTGYSAEYARTRLKRIGKRKQGKEPLVVDPATVKKNVSGISKSLKQSVSRYVITWAQNATPVHGPFLAALERYCAENNARLIVIPGRYKNPTSIWTNNNQENEYWVDAVAPYLMNKRIELSENFLIMGDIKTQPTAETPLSGFQSITHSKSGIFGHPKVQLTSVATPQNKLPKILATTGAVTVQNYTDTKAGKKGEFHHTFGATVIEVEKASGLFHMRQINACDDGSFIDLEREYSEKSSRKAGRPLALVMGDIHAEFMDEDVERATFTDANSIVKTLKPEQIVLHDWIDFYSGSHHHKKDPFTRYAKRKAGTDDVEAELHRAIDRLATWGVPADRFRIVASNHNDHLLRWLSENDPNNDPVNALFFHRLSALVLEQVKYGKSGAEVPNPLELWVKRYTEMGGLHFLGRDDSLMIGGVDCSQHGDVGANGSRGTVRQFAFQGVKTITGHGHAPGIEGGAHRVGTSSQLRMSYNRGASSWLHAHSLIYANGKRSLVFIINGKWRAKK